MSSNPSLPADELNGGTGTDELNQLLDRLFTLSRPIADGFHEPGLDMQLGDPERFFEIIRGLDRLNYPGIEQTLLMLLDEFAQLEQRSYDELYLWSIVELSRRQGDHVEMLWPMALTLDLRFRAEPWARPNELTLLHRPYRLTELVMYFYVMATHQPEPDGEEIELIEEIAGEPPPPPRRYPPLATCLRRIRGHLNDEQQALMLNTLRELAQTQRHPAFGDAHGLLLRFK
jgi:hypothetical protein